MADPEDLFIALARPVRHEANNMLAALSGTAELMLRSPTSTERDILRAERLRDASARLQSLLHAYLALGAPPPDGTPADAVLALMHPLVGLVMRPYGAVDFEVEDSLPALAASPAALQATILRLALDATALASAQGGLRLTLEATPGGALLSAWPIEGGDGPPPVFLPAAEP